MNKTSSILLTVLAFFISIIIVVLESTSNVYYGAKQVYRVYLNGKSIGLISSKKSLETYIDNEQQNIKDKFNVSKVYAPNGLEIIEEITYNEDITTTEKIYNQIKETENFTISGYKITITPSEDDEDQEEKFIYVLDKSILSDAINETVKSFVDEEEYDRYINETQSEIVDTGKIIENVYIKEKITIKEDNISTSEKIFTTEKDLAKYMLFGTTENQSKYIVKDGDTISSIAAANTLSTSEFLIANQTLSSENALLYNGQEVVISLINPIITIVEEDHTVSDEVVKFTTDTVEDSSFYVGYSRVVQNGQNGESRVTRKLKIENGQIISAVSVSSEILKEPVKQIVKTGARTKYVVASTEFWAWPTKTPYIITDYMGPRWGRMHNGIDVAGTGYGSPIYAANDGTVIDIATGYGNNMGSSGMATFGNRIDINHNNGYVTRYAHLKDVYVKPGQAVTMGDLIGTMGNSGYSTGTHLHFEVRYNGNLINPFNLYQ